MLSTGVNFRGTHGIFQMDGGVQISVDCMAARLTDEHSIGQCQAFVLPSTARTGLAAGKERPCLDDGDACILGHVGENAPKLSKRRVAERALDGGS